MKMQRKQSVIEIEEDDDEDFLSQVAAAEAHALASKRRRITPSPSPSANAVVSKQVVDNGLYMAALKGDRTIVRPSTASNPLRGRPPNARGLKVADSGNDDVVGAAATADSCFKCGKSGHWARDCDAVGGGHYGNYGTDPSIPEKTCPCGLGICMVLTANTEKNRGRKFYKCPLRQENGGCGFFEWFDNVSGANSMVGANYSSDSSYPGLQCPCGAGLCMILTAKTGNNIGQQFYRCPANQGSSCGFFKWCNEQTASVGRTVTASNTSYNVRTGSSSYNSSDINNISYNVRSGSSSYNLSDTNHTSFNVRTGSSCFKCGKEGHWARDCSISSLNPQAELGGRSASASVSSGTCYKCGKPGHWSRDCTFC